MSFLEIRANHKKLDGVEAEGDSGYFSFGSTLANLVIRLRKRGGYPTTYCDILPNGDLVMGYGDKQKRPEHEFLTIRITGDRLTIERDKFATLPIYYAVNDAGLVASSHYLGVLEGISRPTLSKARLLEALAPGRARLPLAHQVNYLKAGERLQFSRGGLQIIHPSDGVNKEALHADAKKFFSKFNEYLNFFITTRLNRQRCIFEVSGGLDSATLPQYYSLFYGQTPTFSTIFYAGSGDSPSKQKVQALAWATGAQVVSFTPNPKENYPFCHVIKPYRPHHYGFGGDIYDIYLDRLIPLRPDVIADGFGGDELMSNVIDPGHATEHYGVEKERRKKQWLPTYLTPTFRDEYLAAAPDQSLQTASLLPASVCDPRVMNSIYIDRDMWPVSPFIDLDVFSWCQALPIQFRANKNILRAYHQAYGFVREVYGPPKAEEFGGYFRYAFCSGVYDEVIQDLASASVTAQMDYVDTRELFNVYQRAKSEQYPGVDNDRLTILRWVSAEINAQYSGFCDIS